MSFYIFRNIAFAAVESIMEKGKLIRNFMEKKFLLLLTLSTLCTLFFEEWENSQFSLKWNKKEEFLWNLSESEKNVLLIFLQSFMLSSNSRYEWIKNGVKDKDFAKIRFNFDTTWVKCHCQYIIFRCELSYLCARSLQSLPFTLCSVFAYIFFLFLNFIQDKSSLLLKIDFQSHWAELKNECRVVRVSCTL